MLWAVRLAGRGAITDQLERAFRQPCSMAGLESTGETRSCEFRACFCCRSCRLLRWPSSGDISQAATLGSSRGSATLIPAGNMASITVQALNVTEIYINQVVLGARRQIPEDSELGPGHVDGMRIRNKKTTLG